MRPSRIALAGTVAALALAAPAAAPGATPAWHLEQPPPPPGAPFKVPLGRPGDLQFYSANRGLLSIEGNATIPRGLYAWNGRGWHQLSTVCGGPGDTSRIAFAGPNEWWTVSEPSRPRIGSGDALCHYRGGQVVGSYSTPDQSADPIQQMDAAACLAPNDCWFGGFDAATPTGDRQGAFHLHWDGSDLTTVYAAFGHGVSDIEPFAGDLYESSFLGPRPENTADPIAPPDEATHPELLHRVGAGTFPASPFEPAVEPDRSELLALDSNASALWAVGGGAASGAGVPEGTSVARPPLAVRLSGGTATEVPLDASAFGTNDRLGDVSAVPGSDSAWVAVQPFATRNGTTAKAKVALLSPSGVAEVDRLPTSGAGRGTAARVAFTGPSDGWLVTSAGWLFHYTDGTLQPANTDPAWQGTITFRPNEAAEQFVPDTPPPDDSQLFAPEPDDPGPPPKPPKPKKLKALLRKVHVKLHGTTLVISFQLRRRAKVGLVAKRKGKTVARTKYRMLKPGKHKLKLKLHRKRWPTHLKFRTHEPGVGSGGGDDDTITT